MAAISRPDAYGIVVVIVLAGTLAWSNMGQDAEKKKTAPVAAKKKVITDPDYNDFDYAAHFDPPASKSPLRNLFMPLLKPDSSPAPDAGTGPKDILRIPATFASGDPNWIFTGYAVISGEKQGLLENSANHQGGFVKEGQSWKSSRVASISSGSIAFVDSEGNRVAVTRYDPILAAKGDAKGTGNAPPPAPIDPGPAMNGPIGPGGPPQGVQRLPRVRGGMMGGQNIVIQPNGVVISGG